MSGGALSAALLARRFTLLAECVELLRRDPCERVHVMVRDAGHGANELDVELVRCATELDLVCGYALRRLRDPQEQAAVLDVLGVMPPDYLVGVLYALPDARREEVRRLDGVWNYHALQLDAEMPAALAEVDRIREACDGSAHAELVAELSPDELRELEAFSHATLGIGDEPSLEHCVVLAEGAAMDKLIAAEFEHITPDDDEAAIAEAMRRALDRWKAERRN